MADMNAIYTVLRIGGAMLKFVEEKAEAQAAIDRGHACLSQYCAHPTPNPNLDDLRNALKLILRNLDTYIITFLYLFMTYNPQSDLAVSKGRLFKIQVKLGGERQLSFC